MLGPHASILIHQVTAAISTGGTAEDVREMIHVHPVLNDVVLGAFDDL